MRGRKVILYAGYVIVAALFAISTMLLFFSRNKNEDGKPIKTIGALYMTMNNPYFEVINEEVKAVVESRGDVLETRDSAMDATKKWTGKAWDWGLTLDQLCIYFGDRIQPKDID